MRLDYIFLVRLRCGLGDYVAFTSLIRAMKKLYPSKKIILISGLKEVYENNDDIYKSYQIKNKTFQVVASNFFRMLSNIFSKVIYVGYYKTGKFKSLEEEMRNGTQDNYLKLISRHWKENIDYLNLKNKIIFSEFEKLIYEEKFKNLPENYSLIHSQGKISYTPNKEIGIKNMQSIINNLQEINWIQIGIKNDVALENIKLNFSGKTTIRELFYLISKTKFIVCQEGAYNHIANSFGKKSITIFTGFNPVEIYSYSTTIAIQKENLPDCSPCMLIKERCRNNMICINEEVMKSAIERIKKLRYEK